MDRGVGAIGLRGLAVAAAFLFANVGVASATTLTVTATADPAGTGQCSLREAIATVNSPGTATVCGTAGAGTDTIVLGPNTYVLSIPSTGSEDNGNGDLVVDSPAQVTIMGAGAGSTAIAAGPGLRDRVLTVGLGSNLTLTGVTLTGGRAPGGAVGSSPGTGDGGAGGAGADGGGILNLGSLALVDAAIVDNDAGSGGGGGGGAFAAAGVDNGNGGAGGAGGSGGSGGGIYSTGTLMLTATTVTGNEAGAGGDGGAGGEGLGNDGGAGGNGGCCGDGGGIDNAGGVVVIQGSTISFNRAGDGGSGGLGGPTSGSVGPPGNGGTGQGGSSGGGVASAGGSLSVTNSTLSSNLGGLGGSGGGGGLNESAGQPVQFPNGGTGGGAGNGSAGGAVFVSGGGIATLLNVTVAANQVGGPGTPGGGGSGIPNGAGGGAGNPAFGGGVYANNSAIKLLNTLLASNQLGNCAARGSGGITDGGHNLSFADPSCGTNFAGGDPKLGVLQDNGGPTQTIAPGPGSAALDQIPPTSGACPQTDQRGVPRPSGPLCDIGAYEVAPPVASTAPATDVTPTDATLNGTVTPNAGQASVFFQYGISTSYGARTATQSLDGVEPSAVLAGLTGLLPNTTYHFRVVAISQDGQTMSGDRTFTTGTTPPTTGATPPPRPRKPQEKVNHKLHSVRFTFGDPGATGFQCALVRHKKHAKPAKPHYSTCRSPKTYKHLGKGNYEFFVRGTDAAGVGAAVTSRFSF